MTHLCHFDALNIHRCGEYALDCSFGLYSIAQWGNFTRLDHCLQSFCRRLLVRDHCDRRRHNFAVKLYCREDLILHRRLLISTSETWSQIERSVTQCVYHTLQDPRSPVLHIREFITVV